MTTDETNRLELLRAVLPTLDIRVDEDGILFLQSGGRMISLPIECVELIRWVKDKRDHDLATDPDAPWACSNCGHTGNEDDFTPEVLVECPECGSHSCFPKD